jgi:hypothetical protein
MTVFLGAIEPGMFTKKELSKWKRQSLIYWLERNDRNGTYNDKDVKEEFGFIIPKNQLVDMVYEQQQGL